MKAASARRGSAVQSATTCVSASRLAEKSGHREEAKNVKEDFDFEFMPQGFSFRREPQRHQHPDRPTNDLALLGQLHLDVIADPGLRCAALPLR